VMDDKTMIDRVAIFARIWLLCSVGTTPFAGC
jgi:hypothetical protein